MLFVALPPTLVGSCVNYDQSVKIPLTKNDSSQIEGG